MLNNPSPPATLRAVRLYVTSVDNTRVVSEPMPEAVTAAIYAVDGKLEVELHGTGGTWLGIAGDATRFFLGYSEPEGTIWQARAEKPADSDAEFMIGGQPAVVSAEYLLDAATATAAALHFLATEQRLPSVDWDRM